MVEIPLNWLVQEVGEVLDLVRRDTNVRMLIEGSPQPRGAAFGAPMIRKCG